MTIRKKFAVFCLGWGIYLVACFPLLKWVLVPQFGDVSVVIAVVLGMVAWLVGFLKYGPVLGNWDKPKET